MELSQVVSFQNSPVRSGHHAPSLQHKVKEQLAHDIKEFLEPMLTMRHLCQKAKHEAKSRQECRPLNLGKPPPCIQAGLALH